MENLDELLDSALSEISWSAETSETETPQETIDTQEENKEAQLIPENPPLVLANIGVRFSAADWAERATQTSVLLGGVGGIGSWLALLLSRLQVNNITAYDPDIVDDTNMSGQLYNRRNVRQFKVDALRECLTLFSSFYRINGVSSFYRWNEPAKPIMMCGFDNMEARKDFFNNWSEKYGDDKQALFIDGRLAAEEFQVFAIQGGDTYHQNIYRARFLFNDREAEPTVCSYKQTSHCAAMIASIMVNIFTNFLANSSNPLVERPVPFFTSYDNIRMFFKTDDML